MYLNKAIIIGNLTRDPELKSLPSGMAVATFGVATNRVWKDKDGNRREDTDYHNIVVFGRQAENTAQYLKKGSTVLVEGRITTRSWESDGVKKYRTEIIADKVQFGPRRDGDVSPTTDDATAQEKKDDELETIEYPEEDINPDDIPF